MKNYRGITLVALVITIILLMILVTVLVTMAIKGGLFKIAKKAAEGYKMEQEKERISAILIDMVMRDKKALYSETIKKDLENNLEIENVIIIDRDYYDRLTFIYERDNSKYICNVVRDTAYINLLKNYKKQELNVEDFEKAKNIDYKLSTLDANYGYNVVYTSGLDASSYENEQTWTVNEVKLAAEIYCADNILIYDGTSPYVPVMFRFYRKDEKTSRIRGLKYFVNTNSNMTLSTNNSNNDLAFVNNSNYNYEASSSRKCSTVIPYSTYFNDKTTGHYYASARVSFGQIDLSRILANMGAFSASCCDEDDNVKEFVSGSNYIVNVTEYYNTLREGKELLNSIGETIPTAISTETYDLSHIIVESVENKFEYNENKDLSENAKLFTDIIEGKTIDIKAKIYALKKAQNENISKLTPEVKEVIELAINASPKIPTLSVTGGYNIIYTSKENVLDAYSGYQEWTNKVDSRAEIYCADNIMIYDGTSPHVPVMVRFWRKDDIFNRNKARGLKYFAVTNPTNMTFSTKNDDNSWEFVSEYVYNYDADSDNQQCSSDTSGNINFADSTANSRYASGRLTYSMKPTKILTILGPFEATSADQDGANLKSYSVGSNYVIDVTGYYDEIEKGQKLLDDLMNDPIKIETNVEVASQLAQKINDFVKNEYTFNDAEKFSKEISDATKTITGLIDEIK